MTNEPTLWPVIHEDRVAAARYFKASDSYSLNILRGNCDDLPTVQAFAQHRIECLREKDAEIERLRHYVRHHPYCGAPPPAPRKCTCGLTELLRKIDDDRS